MVGGFSVLVICGKARMDVAAFCAAAPISWDSIPVPAIPPCAPGLTYFTLGCGAVAHPAMTNASPMAVRLLPCLAFMTSYLGQFWKRVKQHFHSAVDGAWTVHRADVTSP